MISPINTQDDVVDGSWWMEAGRWMDLAIVMLFA